MPEFATIKLCRQDVSILTASLMLMITFEGQCWEDRKMNTFQKAFLEILKSQCNFQIKCVKDPMRGKWEVNPKFMVHLCSTNNSESNCQDLISTVF